MPIRPRLTLYAVGVAALGLLLLGLVLLVLARGGAIGDQDETLEGAAGALAAQVAAKGPEGLASDPPPPVRAEPIEVPVLLLVLAEGGDRLWASDPMSTLRVPASVIVEALDRGASVATSGSEPDGETRIAAAAWHQPGRRGVAVAARATAAVDRQMRDLSSFLAIAATIALVAVGLVTWLVIGRALRPLRALTAAADRIAASGDPTQRLPDDRHHDEVGRLTRSFNAMLGRLDLAQRGLADSLDTQRRMVADASHELRTPLTTIRTNAEALRDHPDADREDRQAAVADIADEAARMSRLLDDLLLLARADASQPILSTRRPVDLGALATEVARKASTADRRVTRSAARETCIVDGDPDALARLMWILVDNAARHGAGEVTIDLRRDADGPRPMCRLTVDDEGPGFPIGDEERAFERFWRADATRSGPGAGLGLAIARSICDAHGGTIEAGQRPGGGARVIVRLPDATAGAAGGA